MSDYYEHADFGGGDTSENPYAEPIISHQLREATMVPAARSVHSSTRSRGSSRVSSRSGGGMTATTTGTGGGSVASSTGTQVSYRTKKTSMGMFKKRQTTIDCGSFKKLQNG